MSDAERVQAMPVSAGERIASLDRLRGVLEDGLAPVVDGAVEQEGQPEAGQAGARQRPLPRLLLG